MRIIRQISEDQFVIKMDESDLKAKEFLECFKDLFEQCKSII